MNPTIHTFITEVSKTIDPNTDPIKFAAEVSNVILTKCTELTAKTCDALGTSGKEHIQGYFWFDTAKPLNSGERNV